MIHDHVNFPMLIGVFQQFCTCVIIKLFLRVCNFYHTNDERFIYFRLTIIHDVVVDDGGMMRGRSSVLHNTKLKMLHVVLLG